MDAATGRRGRLSISVLALSLAGALTPHCAETPVDSSPGDAGPEGGFGPLREGSAFVGEQLSCTAGPCESPQESALGPIACCLESGDCGVQATLLGPSCLAPKQPGTVDLSCPERRLPGGTVVQGCCAPPGRCGLFDRAGGLGCVPPELGGDEPQCAPDPAAECSLVADLPCDGAEDCGPGRVCCGRAARDRFDRFGCFESCENIATGRNGVWLELCHMGDPCRGALGCASDPALPDFLARCSVAGARPADASDSEAAPAEAGSPESPGVRCGAERCSTDEKCCLREPLEPYCASLDAPCACTPTRHGPDGEAGTGPDH